LKQTFSSQIHFGWCGDMKKLLSSLIFLLTAICLGLFCRTCSAETKQLVKHLISTENYYRVLDAVFTESPPTRDLIDYSITIRFMPSFRTESEILVQLPYNGIVRATLLTVSGKSVWDNANDYIQRTGRLDLNEIAKKVHVKRQQILISTAQASLWHSEALKSIGKIGEELQKDFVKLQESREVEIFLDGTTYELRLEQGTTDVRCSIIDAAVDDHEITGRSSLARWMNGIRLYFLAHAAK